MARLTSSRIEKAPRAIVVHMKEKLCKNTIFIPHFLTKLDRRYKRGHCGILTKKCHVAPSPLVTQTAPLATHDIAHSTRIYHIRNSSPPIFHPDVSQPPFYPTDIPPHLDVMIRPMFHLLRIFHIRRLPPDGRGGRFNFPGQTGPNTLVTAYLDNLARQTLAIHRIHFRPQ